MTTTNKVMDYRSRLLSNIEETPLVTQIAWVVSFAVLTALLAQIRFYAPWNPWVPYTGQVLGVTLAGLVLGGRLGAASMAVYLALGAIGFPVFAGATGGIEPLIGPTAGYLFGFIVAAYVAGYLSRNWLTGRRALTLARLGMAVLVAMTLVFMAAAAFVGVAGVLATPGLAQTIIVSSVLIAAMGLLLLFWSRGESQAFLARMACGLIGVLIVYIPGVIVLHLATGMSTTASVTVGALQFIPVDLAKILLAASLTAAVLPPVDLRAKPLDQGTRP